MKFNLSRLGLHLEDERHGPSGCVKIDLANRQSNSCEVTFRTPTSLNAIGTQLYKFMELRDTTANSKIPVGNPHVGRLRVEVTPFLANAQYTSNSTKTWYQLAEAVDLPVIEVAFLNGQESPTIETAEANFSRLGIKMRG